MQILKRVLLAVALVIAAAGAFLFYKNNIASSPGGALLNYMKCLENGDYDKMYDMLDQQSQDSISRKAFIERNEKIYEGISMKNLQVSLTTKKREPVVGYRLSMDSCAGTIRFSERVRFQKEKHRWKLEWDDSVIFPGLASTDKIRIKILEADRGEITDRKGRTLAGQGTIYAIGIVPGKMKKDTVKKTAKLLKMSEKEIQKQIQQKWVKKGSFVPICKTDEYPEEILDIAGIMVSKSKDRVYPMGEAAAHLVGYAQNGEGKTGLEKLYDEKLRGTDGKMIYIQDSKGSMKEKIAIKAEENGQDIQTTIDGTLQKKIYDQYKKDKSAHVAMNPKTGEILALVSTPSYDNQALSLGMNHDQWKAIVKNKDHPMQNRFKGIWSPGSSMKPIVGAIGLTQNKFKASDDFGNNGTRWRKDGSWGGYYVTTLHNYANHNLRNALIYSDNIYFAKAALKIGKDTFEKQLEAIGFRENISFPFGLTPSSYGGNGITSEIQLADSGYGQGQMLVNPVHMAAIYSAFYNQGNMLQPQLIKTEDLKKKIWKSSVFSKSAVDMIYKDMVQVVESPHGTGRAAQTSDLKIAGKTGTAEIKASQGDTKGTEIGWFVTITKKADKSLELVSMTEDVKKRGGSGYVVAKTKKILESYMQ